MYLELLDYVFAEVLVSERLGIVPTTFIFIFYTILDHNTSVSKHFFLMRHLLHIFSLYIVVAVVLNKCRIALIILGSGRKIGTGTARTEIRRLTRNAELHADITYFKHELYDMRCTCINARYKTEFPMLEKCTATTQTHLCVSLETYQKYGGGFPCYQKSVKVRKYNSNSLSARRIPDNIFQV